MSTARQDPRANQKARTRAAIVEAAKRLRAEAGATPGVAQAAAVAGVSRATAYRYFPTQEALEVEVADITPDVAATEEALGAMPDERKQRLRAALALTLGSDSLVVMKDVCRLDDDQALEVLRWTATAILRAALAEPDSKAT